MRNDKVPAAIVFTALSVMLASVVIAPFLSSPGTIVGIDGSVGMIDNGGLWAALDPFSSFVYSVGDYLCHQMMSRSYMLNGNQMPICSRDTGILLGFMAASAVIIRTELDTGLRTSVLLVSPLVIDGALQLFTAYESNNVFRLITGLLAGVGAMMYLNHLMRTELREIEKGVR